MNRIDLPRPWKKVEHNWKDTSIYSADGKVVCSFDLENLGEVTEDNQEEMERRQSEIVDYILDSVNSNPNGPESP